jgi:hypothetical protein
LDKSYLYLLCAAKTHSKNFASAKVLNQDISFVKADDLLNLSAQRGINTLHLPTIHQEKM